jgi:hypothetical protein
MFTRTHHSSETNDDNIVIERIHIPTSYMDRLILQERRRRIRLERERLRFINRDDEELQPETELINETTSVVESALDSILQTLGTNTIRRRTNRRQTDSTRRETNRRAFSRRTSPRNTTNNDTQQETSQQETSQQETSQQETSQQNRGNMENEENMFINRIRTTTSQVDREMDTETDIHPPSYHHNHQYVSNLFDQILNEEFPQISNIITRNTTENSGNASRNSSRNASGNASRNASRNSSGNASGNASENASGNASGNYVSSTRDRVSTRNRVNSSSRNYNGRGILNHTLMLQNILRRRNEETDEELNEESNENLFGSDMANVFRNYINPSRIRIRHVNNARPIRTLVGRPIFTFGNINSNGFNHINSINSINDNTEIFVYSPENNTTTNLSDVEEIEEGEVVEERMCENETNRVENQNICAICQEEFQENSICRRLNICNHYFHHRCIDGWLNTHSNCPLCRQELFNTGQSDNTRESNTGSSTSTDSEDSIPSLD